LNEWREGAKGAFQMGLKHGSTCVSCCWAQMLIMFAVGVMNLFGMAFMALLILAEKIVPVKSQLISRAGGVLFMGWGLWLLQMA
jgi:predicted metal-binding membrane protein